MESREYETPAAPKGGQENKDKGSDNNEEFGTTVNQLTTAYNSPCCGTVPSTTMSPVPSTTALLSSTSVASISPLAKDIYQAIRGHSFLGYALPLSTFKTIDQLLENNKKWANTMVKEKPDFFSNLAAMQSPKVLWIGCSDSRVPANQIIGLGPGEVFVHRNVANLVHHTDLNCMSVVQYAVEVLKVEHIIVCGHYGCGGVLASMTENSYGLIDHWLMTIKHVYQEFQEQLDSIQDWKTRADTLCELNILRSVHNLCNSTIVKSAWTRGQNLSVHGWCYRLTDGIIRDLRIRVNSTEGIPAMLEAFKSRESNP